MEKNRWNILGTKHVLIFALSSIAEAGKNAPLISLAFEATILIRNDSVSSKEYERKCRL